MSAVTKLCECGRVWMQLTDGDWDETGALAWCHACIDQDEMAAAAWSNNATLVAAWIPETPA